MKKDVFDKLFCLIAKEIELFDKRPKKQRKNHPGKNCYMNDIFKVVRDVIDKSYYKGFEDGYATKKRVRRIKKDQ